MRGYRQRRARQQGNAMTPPPPLAADPAAELAAIGDDLRRLANALPVMTACRVRVWTEELAVEAMRLAAIHAGER